MSTDDVTKFQKPCLCGKGEIEITVTSPDHAWAKPHQTTYSYELKCGDCEKQYVITDDSIVGRAAYEAHLAVERKMSVVRLFGTE